MSVYLGTPLEELLENIEAKGSHTSAKNGKTLDIGHVLPMLSKDNTDRNRTSPIAFTGNKFEFRALGSSASPSFLVTVLNAAIAESLNEILDEISRNPSESLTEASIPVLQTYLKQSKGVRFSGDNYSEEWKEEAARRKLPNIAKSIDAFEALKSPETLAVFKNILTSAELLSRYEVIVEHFAHSLAIEYKTMLELFYTKILPAAQKQIEEVATTLNHVHQATEHAVPQLSEMQHIFGKLIDLTEASIAAARKLKEQCEIAKTLPLKEQAMSYANEIQKIAATLRELADSLEEIINDSHWQLPKYHEMLFII